MHAGPAVACALALAASGCARLGSADHAGLDRPLRILDAASVDAVGRSDCAPAPGAAAGSAWLAPQTALLSAALAGLGPDVDAGEAARVADAALRTALTLRRRYGVAGPPRMHNLLVNLGVKDKGLCFDWTHDLMEQLRALAPRTLDLYWGMANPWDALRQHSSVVVTAHGRPFSSGLVLDGWRAGGCLYWVPVTADSYPWEEAIRYPVPAAHVPGG
ncbi:MAG: hypothetical protein AB7Q97_06355 [Gammaproteobacteria bacterium]